MHLLYHTKQYPNIDVLPYLPPSGRDRLLFVTRSDDRYGYLWSGFHLCESTHRNDIIFRPDSFVYVHRGLYIIRTLFDESAHLAVAYIFPPIMLARLQEILRTMQRQKARMTSELKLWAAFNALHLQPSSKEIQLCCLILENKTTEEIAALQYIATSTVRSNRSRLRQKLQLNQETDLQTFLSELIKKDFDYLESPD